MTVVFFAPVLDSQCTCAQQELFVVVCSDLQHMKPKNCKAELKMLGDFHPVKPCIIHDPYGVCILFEPISLVVFLKLEFTFSRYLLDHLFVSLCLL